MAIVEGVDVDFLATSLPASTIETLFEAGNFSEAVFDAIVQASAEILGTAIEGPADRPTPRFNTGRVVWLPDGRSGSITRRWFDQDMGLWFYEVQGLLGAFDESQLLGADPFIPPIIASERQELRATDFITLSDLGLATETLRQDLEQQLSSLAVTLTAEIADARVAASRELRERFLRELNPVVQAIFELRELTNRRFAIRQSVVTDALDLLGNSLSIITGDPLSWFLENAGENILQEIVDGLNR